MCYVFIGNIIMLFQFIIPIKCSVENVDEVGCVSNDDL